jgi:uncharacterized protein
MKGETRLDQLLKNMNPRLNKGEYVFCTLQNLNSIDINDALMIFKEEEATSLILKKEIADNLNLEYTFVAAWITLTVHSALEAVGLTAAVSNALAQNNISCNMVAAFYHDHIFVDIKDAKKAMEILNQKFSIK